jgi:polyribonucleotide nucleotidyltransferase
LIGTPASIIAKQPEHTDAIDEDPFDSKISDKRIDKVEDVLNLGDTIKVKVNEIDKQNRVNLINAALEENK